MGALEVAEGCTEILLQRIKPGAKGGGIFGRNSRACPVRQCRVEAAELAAGAFDETSPSA